MNISRTGFLIIGLPLLLSGCCGFPGCVSTEFCGDREYAAATAYVRNHWPRDTQDFQSFTLKKQYRINVVAKRCSEPPILSFKDQIALRGKEAVPFLSEKLRATNDDKAKRDIIEIFDAMSFQRTYDVQGDSELMLLMREAVRTMKDKFWKWHSQKILFVLRGKEVVPFLTEKLRTTNDAATKTDIVRIFIYMSWHNTYDIKSDHGLILLMRESIKTMENEHVRKYFQNQINKILSR